MAATKQCHHALVAEFILADDDFAHLVANVFYQLRDCLDQAFSFRML